MIFIDAIGVKIRDGAHWLPEAVAQVWPAMVVQTCIVHLLRNRFRYASRKDWSAIARDLKPVYTAPTETAALDRFVEFSEKWEDRYPAIVKLWFVGRSRPAALTQRADRA